MSYKNSFMNFKALLSLFLILSCVMASCTADQRGTINVPIQNLRHHGRGKLHVGLFDREGGTNKSDRVTAYDLSKAAFQKQVEVTSSSMNVKFENIPHGEYALLAYHDLSGNGKLDSNFIGIPTEDLSMSNNVKGGPMGGPKWDTAKFKHDSRTVTHLDPIKMTHMYRGS